MIQSIDNLLSIQQEMLDCVESQDWEKLALLDESRKQESALLDTGISIHIDNSDKEKIHKILLLDKELTSRLHQVKDETGAALKATRKKQQGLQSYENTLEDKPGMLGKPKDI